MWSGQLTAMPHYIFFWAILLGTFAFAFWRGRSDERTVAAVCLLATLATQFVIPPPQDRYAYLDLELVLIDLAVLLAFVAVAVRSDRFWPLWISGLQLTISISHLLKAIDADLVPRAYAAAAA